MVVAVSTVRNFVANAASGAVALVGKVYWNAPSGDISRRIQWITSQFNLAENDMNLLRNFHQMLCCDS